MPKPLISAVPSRACNLAQAVLRMLALSVFVIIAFARPVAAQATRTAEVGEAQNGSGSHAGPASRGTLAGRTDDLVRTPVTIARPDGVRLSGEVIAPADPPAATLPGMVLVHGSGPGKRSGLRPYAEGYARAS